MDEPSRLLTLVTKIGIVIAVGFVAYLVVKIMARFLVGVVVWSSPENEEPADATDDQEPKGTSLEYVPGLHLYSDYGAEHVLVDEHPTEKTIRATIRKLDWVNGFHQVVLVKPPDTSLEVGGSLAPDIGLSSAYSVGNEGITKVIKVAPTTVEQMEDLLVSFHSGDGRWEKLNEYE